MTNYNKIMLTIALTYCTMTTTELSAETIKETLQMAINRSPTIKYHTGRIASAESSIGEARSGWLPNVSLNAGNELTKTNKDNNNNDDGNTYSLKVEQNIFDFGRTGDRVDYAEHNRTSEVYTAFDEAEVLSSKVAEIYLNILKYQDLIDINKKNSIEHRNILTLAEARASGGVDSRGDVEQVEVRIKGLDAELSNYEAQLKAAQEDYLILVGKRPSGLSVPDVKQLKNKLSGRMKQRIANSPRVKAIKANKEAAASEYAYTSKSWMPALSVSLSQGKTTTYGENDTLVMLNINSNVFDGGGAIYRSRGAAQRVESARWNIEKSIEDLSTKVSQMYQDALSQENQANIYAQRIIHSQEVKELYHEQYKVNRRSVLDVLNSEQEFFQTMSNKVNAEFNFRILLIRVFSELGEINNAFNIKVNFDKQNDGNFVTDMLGFNNSQTEKPINITENQAQAQHPENQRKIELIETLSAKAPLVQEKNIEKRTILGTSIIDKSAVSTPSNDASLKYETKNIIHENKINDLDNQQPVKEIEDPLLLIGVRSK
ncbi:type I secretion system outer membrane protein [Pragia fontium]|uniref:Type I secretion system outer membrane protein n=1 Tax=Pragia fontium TaxID=82985 RepID=A0ABQ5LG40_9GAMM|nr:TolC family outer membrane protein [Pragia fontium]GKX61792.1 type I secretion system outer membrane protein [Pragia fontium]